jgi:hypothetical protein
LSGADRRRALQPDARGGVGLVTPEKRDGIWHARRDIELGRGIADYAACDKP